MPKKGGKVTRAQKEAADESYRPGGLTLSNFLVASETPSKPLTVETAPNGSSDIGATGVTTSAAAERLHTDFHNKNDQNQGIEFRIKRTKKGNLPLTYESRAKGKKVTVISNVSGDSNALLSLLKKATGTGGAAKGEMVELQGDHRKFLETYLKKHPCLH